MAFLPVFLKVRKRRRHRDQLIAFLESLCLFLWSGFDLSFAWAEAYKDVTELLDPELAGWLLPRPQETTSDRLQRCSRDFPYPGERVWFRALYQLYSQGAPLSEAFHSMAAQVREEKQRDQEAFLKALPLKVNLLLLLWLVPPLFACLFWPLIHLL